MKVSKILAVVLAVAMLLSLSACAAKPANNPTPAPDDGGAKSYTIGINTWGSGVPVLDMFGDAKEYTLTTLGHKVNRMSDDFTADKELQNVQNMCASGVDGIVFQAAAVSTVPQIGVECANAKIPFAFDVFVGENPDLEALAASNEYYCGAIDLDMVSDGKAVAQMAFDAGCRKACMIGGNIGDNNMDQRSQGFTERFTELGGEVLAEARCTDNSECPAKATDMLSANRDADCVYCFVGDYIEGTLTAKGNLGLDGVKIFVSCVDEATARYIKEGTVMGGNDGISLASYISCTLVLNYLAGHKIVDADGKAPRLSTHPFQVNQDNVDNYLKVFFSETAHPFTKAMLEDLLFTSNPNVSYDDYVKLVNEINLDYMLESNGLK
ncbi:MAG: substrate-binding domain-containing protein [Oscillospiraceae bacterium]|jgi:ABC-type sugar transport system substrate-binding protein|nr:substrate-binding domain-containing protein [Oscillospiraceae bacterium]